MHEYTVRISDAEKKALESDVESIQKWINNAVHSKARRLIKNIVKRAIAEDGLLAKNDRETIQSDMARLKLLIADPENIPSDIRDKIVMFAEIKSAVEQVIDSE